MTEKKDPNEPEEIIDIEECAKAGRTPPKAKHYRIRIDKEKFTVDVPCMTGRELLVLARKTPPEQYMISRKLKGGQAQTIGLDETTCFTDPGVERYMTLPLAQQEG